LQALPALLRGAVPHPPPFGSGRHTAHQVSSPFHIALLSSKTCGFSRHANLEIRVTRCLLPSVVKDRSFRSSASDRNVSAPGGAPSRFGAAMAILQSLK